MRALLGFAILAGLALSMPAHAQGVASDGQKLFAQRCAACHGTTPAERKPQGPHLAGVVGRKAAADAEFKYSPAFQKLTSAWDDKSLDEYLAGPAKAVPGSTMVLTVPQQADREDIIAYLKTLN